MYQAFEALDNELAEPSEIVLKDKAFDSAPSPSDIQAVPPALKDSPKTPSAARVDEMFKSFEALEQEESTSAEVKSASDDLPKVGVQKASGAGCCSIM